MTEPRKRLNQSVGAVRGMFMFALLAVFAVLSVIVVLVGARVYRAVDERGSDNYTTRTALSYIAGKVRASDAAGRIKTISLDGAEALVLEADYDGTLYATYIYAHEGQLMEYFGREGREFSLSHGETIGAAGGFTSALQDGLLILSIQSEDGRTETLKLYLQSGEGGA